VRRPPTSPAATVEARFHDGLIATAHPVTLCLEAGGIVVLGEGFTRQYDWGGTRISERLGSAPRLLSFEDGAFCEIPQQAALDAALRTAGYRAAWGEWLPQHWGRVVLALALLLTAIGATYRWGLPLAADLVARQIPVGAERALGARAADYFESQMLKPSKLPEARRRELQQLFESLVPRGDRSYRLALHDGGPIGANALALPGGTVVLTDQLVELAPDDDALRGVLAHEIGHVERRHVLRQIISATVVSAVATLVAGDTSGLFAALPATLANLSYTRAMEREADRYAIESLKARSIALEPFAVLLERLQREHGQTSVGAPAYLSTHPDTVERVRAIRAAQERLQFPSR